MRRIPVPAALVLVLVMASPAVAAPRAPMVLPGDAAAASVRADAATWLIGAKPGRAAQAIARRHGARRTGSAATGAHVVAKGRARALAAALDAAGLLVYAEPNRLAERRQAVGADPLSPFARWREVVANPGIAPPPVTPASPILALIDTQADLAHPEFAGSGTVSLHPAGPYDAHGTATAAVAGAPVNGVGIVGIWPGMRTVNVGFAAGDITCDDSAQGIAQAIEVNAAVINMSYGSADVCYTEYVQIQYAIGKDIIPVASAGNEFAQGNPLDFPASLPHVVTVAAVNPDGSPTYFSNANAAMDLAAPGAGIVTAVPAAFDGDGTPDGYTSLDGTSFSAPMVAAVATWVKAARPNLSGGQVADVLRDSATDLGEPGYDPSTGYGLVSVANALTVEARPNDPLEPNDDIDWVNGRLFTSPDRAVFNGSRRRPVGFDAALDIAEDPDDVYRIVLPGGARARVTLQVDYGAADLLVFGSKARRVDSARYRVARSRRSGRRTERLTIRNSTARKRTYYVAARSDPRARRLDAGYTLSLRRL